jgi:hypothetical protein
VASDEQPPEVRSRPEPVTVMCPECGELVEVRDVPGLIRALHLTNECEIRTLLTTQE